MTKKLLEMAADIVKSQASLNKMSYEEIESTLARTYNALYKMQRAEDDGQAFVAEKQEKISSAPHNIVNPRDSIQENKVICLECGIEMRQLTANHLANHGLSLREYKRKYGFPLKQPLSAKSLTRLRSKTAKKKGVPPELKAFQEEQRLKKQQMQGVQS